MMVAAAVPLVYISSIKQSVLLGKKYPIHFCHFLMSGLPSFTPDSVALKSFMNWIRVRTYVTSLRKTLETNEVFHVLKDTPSFSRDQKEILRALQRIYESGKHKIYSAFASEDLCIALFHENVRYVQCHDDAHGF